MRAAGFDPVLLRVLPSITSGISCFGSIRSRIVFRVGSELRVLIIYLHAAAKALQSPLTRTLNHQPPHTKQTLAAMSDDEKQQDSSVQLMEVILKKLDCLDVLDARLTELDRQQRLHSASLQRLEQRLTDICLKYILSYRVYASCHGCVIIQCLHCMIALCWRWLVFCS